MSITKEEAIKQLGNQSNQQALVKRIQGTKVAPVVKHVIPAGKTLANDIEARDLHKAVYTWLCRSRHWTRAFISFARNPALFDTSENKAVDFDPKAKTAAWEHAGKRKIAQNIADIINTTENLVAVKIERDGIYTITESEGRLTPDSEDWEPYVELVPFKPPTF